MKAFIIFTILVLCLIMVAYLAQAYDDTIEDLIPYIIKVESNGNATAIGEAGEIGLMQISPIVLKEYNNQMYPKYKYLSAGIENLLNPKYNIAIGRWYLNRLKDHYIPQDKYSLEVLLACYNAGPTWMRKVDWDWQNTPISTQTYIRKVLKLYNRGEEGR